MGEWLAGSSGGPVVFGSRGVVARTIEGFAILSASNMRAKRFF